MRSHDDLNRRYPILAEHVGFPPDTPSDETPLHIRDLNLRRDVERLHGLPARVTFELLREIGATRQILTLIEERTAAFAAVDPDALAVTGGDHFPQPPIQEVPR